MDRGFCMPAEITISRKYAETGEELPGEIVHVERQDVSRERLVQLIRALMGEEDGQHGSREV